MADFFGSVHFGKAGNPNWSIPRSADDNRLASSQAIVFVSVLGFGLRLAFGLRDSVAMVESVVDPLGDPLGATGSAEGETFGLAAALSAGFFLGRRL